jgi:membrane-associated protease RseP (regulator of RpoE activity)
LPGEVWTPHETPDAAAGGPLFHRWGKLVGVHTHRSGFGGFVYSTFGKDRGHLERMKRGEVWGGWKLGTGPLIGVVLRTTVHGCQVAEVLPHTAAAKRGLRTGDTVRKIRGQAVASLDDANQALAETQPGDEVEVEYERSSRPATVRLSLAPRDP